MMKKVLICLSLLFAMGGTYGQQTNDSEITIPMEPKRWEYEPDQVAFITHQGVPAIQGLNGGAKCYLKDYDFENGTIEFDVMLNESGFVGINFRETEDRAETEHFYLRAFWPVNPLSRTTTQYATVLDSLSLWDLTDDYQAPANLSQEEWNHVKLVVHGRQMKVYVNDLEQPAMHVPVLEGSNEAGGVSLNGNGIFANLVIRADAVEDLPAAAGYDPTQHDSYYLKNWQVTQPVDFPPGHDLVETDLPDSATQWTPLAAEHRALVNLSRPFGMVSPGDRRLAWLKTTISSEEKQSIRLDMGFSDEVWVLINGQLLHIDKNYYGSPSMKEPRGRCTLDNTSFDLPLQKGENELLVGLANSFYGWGIIARLENVEGITAK